MPAAGLLGGMAAGIMVDAGGLVLLLVIVVVGDGRWERRSGAEREGSEGRAAGRRGARGRLVERDTDPGCGGCEGG